MLLLRGGVPRRNSFPTVVGEQPSSLAMALFESPCRLRYWIAPLSSRPRCCPFLRSAATVIYCVQSIVIALLLVNVVWELHSTIRVKSLWIFFSQVSNFIMQSTFGKETRFLLILSMSISPIFIRFSPSVSFSASAVARPSGAILRICTRPPQNPNTARRIR